MADLRRENGVLMRTEAILRARDSNIAEFNAKLEQEKGVQGFSEAQEQLENVSGTAGQIDKSEFVLCVCCAAAPVHSLTRLWCCAAACSESRYVG